ncbi:MAG TPA: type II and III secretion system protein [Candidatus Bathyarchaeia archaeon]|nr:type II and III secretion system protein [Candidatus Bathyarchaeia archaeon]
MMRALTVLLLILLVSATGVAWGQAAPPGTPMPKMPDAPTPSEHAAARLAAPAVPEGQPPRPPLKPLDQVQIKVWITEYNERGLRELGTNLQYTRVVRGVEQSGTVQQISTNTFNDLNPSFSATLPAPDETLFDPPLRPDQNTSLAGIQTQAGGGLVASILGPGYGTVEALFRAIEQKSEVDLVSKPEVLVIDNGIAEIHAGGQVPYQNIAYTAAGVGQLNVTWENIGVNMQLQPLILPNNSVQLDIKDLGVSDVVRVDNIRGIDLPVFATRKQTGNVIVPDGNTFVIGGLSSRVVQKTERRVPILGKIPLIGIGFRGRNSRATNSHLLIFVQPTIVDLRELTPEANNALNFWRSPEWQNSERIGREVTAMEEEPF